MNEFLHLKLNVMILRCYGQNGIIKVLQGCGQQEVFCHTKGIKVLTHTTNKLFHLMHDLGGRDFAGT